MLLKWTRQSRSRMVENLSWKDLLSNKFSSRWSVLSPITVCSTWDLPIILFVCPSLFHTAVEIFMSGSCLQDYQEAQHIHSIWFCTRTVSRLLSVTKECRENVVMFDVRFNLEFLTETSSRFTCILFLLNSAASVRCKLYFKINKPNLAWKLFLCASWKLKGHYVLDQVLWA